MAELKIYGNDIAGTGEIKVIFSSLKDVSPLLFHYQGERKEFIFAVRKECLKELLVFLFNNIVQY